MIDMCYEAGQVSYYQFPGGGAACINHGVEANRKSGKFIKTAKLEIQQKLEN